MRFAHVLRLSCLSAAVLPTCSFLLPLHRSSALASASLGVRPLSAWRPEQQRVVLRAEGESTAAGEEEEEDQDTPPGKMKVSELKAELDLRGVSYAGVFERAELERLLLEARADGVARPEILDTFNAQREGEKEGEFRKKLEDFDWEAAKASDGNLPGGMSKDAVQKLTSNEELMSIMANPSLQDLMKATMEKDTAKMSALMQDPEVVKLIQRFNELAQEAGIDPSMLR